MSHGLIKVLSQYFPGETEKNHTAPQDSQCHDQGSNWAPHKYKTTVLLQHHPA
jgi:hypothetical protein